MASAALVKGTRDFGPEEYRQRHYIIDTVRRVYELYGFQPLETPAMELLETLCDTYGDEGDKLIFRILDSGDFMEKVPYPAERKGSWASDGLFSENVVRYISEKALRYDLTVPFARYVSMNVGRLTFPFKRYQIQPVWRADRPQKGRYREFYQCDADVIGSDSLLYEAEFLAIFKEVFEALKLDKHIVIRINHRRLLQSFCSWAGNGGGSFSDFCVLWDKADKVPLDKLMPEFENKGFKPGKIKKMIGLRDRLMQAPVSSRTVEELSDFASEEGVSLHDEKMPQIEHQKNMLPRDTAMQLLEALRLSSVMSFRNQDAIQDDNNHHSLYYLDLSLARGLDYYTGFIFEATPREGGGSLAGGGRYDNLTERFGIRGHSGVGISFGADRILDYMKTGGLLNDIAVIKKPQLLLVHTEDITMDQVLALACIFRSSGISTEVYPEKARLKKQIEFAVKKDIPFAGIAGSDELHQNRIALKHLATGTQESLTPEAAVQRILAHHA